MDPPHAMAAFRALACGQIVAKNLKSTGIIMIEIHEKSLYASSL